MCSKNPSLDPRLLPDLNSSPAYERSRLTLRRLQVADEAVFVFHQIDIRPRDVAVQKTLLNLTNNKAEPLPFNCELGVLTEVFELPHGKRLFYPCSSGHLLQIRFTARRRRLADSGSTIGLVVEDED